MSSIFTVPNVRLQPESGESMRAFGKNNSYGKCLSNSKHWWAQRSQESTGKMTYFTWKVILNRYQIGLLNEIFQIHFPPRILWVSCVHYGIHHRFFWGRVQSVISIVFRHNWVLTKIVFHLCSQRQTIFVVSKSFELFTHSSLRWVKG